MFIFYFGLFVCVLCNNNILNKFTTAKTEKSIEFAYFYHLIRNDLSNSVPGIINNENSIYLKDQNIKIAVLTNFTTEHQFDKLDKLSPS